MKYYIAYGSNLNKEQMQARCPGAVPVYNAFIDDWRLMYKGSKTGAYLTIEPHKGDRVPVVLWEINEKHEKALDRYEGYPVFYYKKDNFFLNTPEGRINAFAYIMTDGRGYGIPSDYYIETCEQGYEDFGFDVSFLHKAFDDTVNIIGNA